MRHPGGPVVLPLALPILQAFVVVPHVTQTEAVVFTFSQTENHLVNRKLRMAADIEYELEIQ